MRFREKCVVTVFGHEIILRSATKKVNKGEDENQERVDDGDDENEAKNDKDADEGDIEFIS